MVRASTVVVLLGVALLLVPIPPFITAAVGGAVILAGVALRLLTDR